MKAIALLLLCACVSPPIEPARCPSVPTCAEWVVTRDRCECVRRFEVRP
jgi:hypothetical protein